VHEEIGTAAGVIWQALNANGERSLPGLKQQVEAKAPVFDWALGWLGQEGKIVIAHHQRGHRVRLTDAEARATGAWTRRACHSTAAPISPRTAIAISYGHSCLE
jgi:hypothetical protein